MNLYQEEENHQTSPHQPPASATISGWFIAVPLVGVVLLGATIIIGGGWLGAVKPSTDRLVYRAEGQDTATCPESFTVTDGWELRWEHDGELQEICWTNSIGSTECYTAMHRKPIRYHGSVNINHGGTYTLNVAGTGHWVLEVYRLGE